LELTGATKSLQTPVQYVKGIGEKRAERLLEVGVETIHDLLYYLPRRYLDRSHITKIRQLIENTEVTVVGKVQFLGVKEGRKKRFVLSISDETGNLHCVWFQSVVAISKIFEKGEMLALSGKVTRFGNDFQMAHPDFDRLDDTGTENLLHTGRIIPLYPSTDKLSRVGLDSRGFRRTAKEAVSTYCDMVAETLPANIIQRRQLLGLRQAIENVHFPENAKMLNMARRRLKFDELFYLELMLAYRKRRFEVQKEGIGFIKVGERTRNLIKSLSFELTGAQKKVLREIREDMKGKTPMNRLVQGDVGSGKTVVALITMMMAIENGYQAALMAPTEILAVQHFLSVREALSGLDVNVALLIGSQRKKERESALQAIALGEADIIIGTHALIQQKVIYKKLGVAIIDEQHRFGVLQRATLRDKGLTPDVLVMTATPIPRTLSLTLYGDLDVSIIDELPPGRKEVKTVWRSDSKRNDIYQFVKKCVADGEQIYIVFPLIEESEKIDLQAAVDNYEFLREGIFRDFNVGLLHGRMKSDEKEAVMLAFKQGEIQVLVSTTVIEVGVNVPNATIMIIENAERFGLPQLHQLRGRVGRGEKKSHCFLVAKYPISGDAKKRLQTLSETSDGFKIAEVDLQLRGPGEFFGTKQSGLPELRIADLVKDTEILTQARDEAFQLARNDKQILDFVNQPVRAHFFKNYRDKFELSAIG